MTHAAWGLWFNIYHGSTRVTRKEEGDFVAEEEDTPVMISYIREMGKKLAFIKSKSHSRGNKQKAGSEILKSIYHTSRARNFFRFLIEF